MLARFAALLLICFFAAASAAEKKPTIIATTAMIGDVVAEVAGDTATVETLMGPGIDPHLHKPTRADRNKLKQADAIFYNGLLLEGRLVDIFIKLARQKPVIAVASLIPEENLLELEPDYIDPHVWNDPLAWRQTVKVIADELIKLMPAHAATIEANAQAYEARIDAFHAYADKVVATIPASARVLITAHDAFGYLGRRYNITVKGVQGISTDAEASLQDVNNMVDFLVSKKIPAIFVESSVSDKNIKALIEGAASKGHKVIIGGELFSDAMGPAGSYTGTYLGMQDHNITTLVRALGGQADATGMAGKLTGSH